MTSDKNKDTVELAMGAITKQRKGALLEARNKFQELTEHPPPNRPDYFHEVDVLFASLYDAGMKDTADMLRLLNVYGP